ncbi:MAG: YHS domain-containing protein [Chloroflexi bacterium]|nr:MAG: YHS domain-containing protein [Chloroflexota bacterium]
MSAARCVICGVPLAEGAIRVRYEDRIYAFDSPKCKRIFQENPDRYLDATGDVLEEPR